MSLSAIRELRMQGQRPSAVVTVLIGPVPRWKTEQEALVVIPAGVEPGLMDFRPLVGLWVALVLIGDDYELAGKTLDALKGCGAKLFGAAYPDGTYPCVAEPTREHHRVLRETRELLCR